MDTSPNLQLAYLMAAQSQKHVTYNEAMRTLDALVQPAVLDKDLATPPSSPADGDRYIVAASPSGAWAGQAGRIAAYQDGAWAFYAPREGWLAWVADEDLLYVHDGAAWDVLSIVGGAALDALGPLTPAADRLPYFTGASSAALATFTSFGRSLVDDADVAAARATLGLVIGTDVQGYDADLATLAANITAFGHSLVDDANAAAARSTLGLGTAATQNTGTSGANVPLLNGANSWSASQTISIAAAGAALLTLADTTAGRLTSLKCNAAGGGELKFEINAIVSNVVSYQNLHASGFSAIAFYSHDAPAAPSFIGNERAAFGYGNASCPAPFAGKAYFESSYLDEGVVGAGNGYTPLILVTTGYVANFGGADNHVRQEFLDDGDCIFYGGPDGAEENLRLFHDKGGRIWGPWELRNIASQTALKTVNHEWTGSGTGASMHLHVAWNTSGVVRGLDIDVGYTAAHQDSCGLLVRGQGAKAWIAPLANATGLDSPRATGLTVTTAQNGNFTPGSDPQDANRQFSLIATAAGTHPVVMTLRNTYSSVGFMDQVLDPNYASSKYFFQWAQGTYDNTIPLMMYGNGIGVGGNVGTLTSHFTIAAGTTAKSQVNLAASTAPSSPVDGDIWFDGTDLKLRAGGTTYTVTKT